MNDGFGDFSCNHIERFTYGDKPGVNKFATCSLQERYVIVSGGEDDYVKVSSVERYDLKKDIWEEIASLNEARGSHSSCSIGDTVYVFGGIDP